MLLVDETTPQGMAYAWLVDDAFNGDYYLDDETITERYALAVFYFSLNGDDWITSDNWLSSEEIYQWHGIISCTIFSIEIDLRKYNKHSSSYVAN